MDEKNSCFACYSHIPLLVEPAAKSCMSTLSYIKLLGLLWPGEITLFSSARTSKTVIVPKSTVELVIY